MTKGNLLILIVVVFAFAFLGVGYVLCSLRIGHLEYEIYSKGQSIKVLIEAICVLNDFQNFNLPSSRAGIECEQFLYD